MPRCSTMPRSARQQTNVSEHSGFEDEWTNNTCVLGTPTSTPYYFDADPCAGTHSFPRLLGNSFLAPSSGRTSDSHSTSLRFPQCISSGQRGTSLAAWQAAARNWDGSSADRGSAVAPTPTDDELVGKLRAVLGF